MGFLRTTMVMAVSVAIFAYVTRPKFPDTASNRSKKVITGMLINSMESICSIAGIFGYSPIKCFQALSELAAIDIGSPPSDVQETTTVIEGVEVMIFKPARETKELRPGLIYAHGGGWVLMTPAHYAFLCRTFVQQTQSVIVSINYRRAPDHRFPAAIDDCIKVTRYVLNNAEKFGIDGTRVAIRGDSAGGNLAMAVALNLSTTGYEAKHPLKAMILDYPALQAINFQLPACRKYDQGPGMLNKQRLIGYWLYYAFGKLDFMDLFSANDHLRKEVKEQMSKHVNGDFLPADFQMTSEPSTSNSRLKNSEVTKLIFDIVKNPMFSPLAATDEQLARLPAARVMCAEIDVLRDDGLILVERLKRVGVHVEHAYYPNEEHGFLSSEIGSEAYIKEMRETSKFYNKTVVG